MSLCCTGKVQKQLVADQVRPTVISASHLPLLNSANLKVFFVLNKQTLTNSDVQHPESNTSCSFPAQGKRPPSVSTVASDFIHMGGGGMQLSFTMTRYRSCSVPGRAPAQVWQLWVRRSAGRCGPHRWDCSSEPTWRRGRRKEDTNKNGVPRLWARGVWHRP